MMKVGDTMKKLADIMIKVIIATFALFLVTVAVYWLNLDTKLVKALEKPMKRHYDSLPRDHKL